jgi:hypothetical protein
MTKTPTNSHNQAGQIVHQFNITTTHLSDVAASCPLNTSLSSQETVSSMTFSQKFDRSQALEIAEEFEQALEANSLENLKQLFDKVLEISPSNK